MSKDIFEFQKFTIKQDKSAMKVGTDSVLLGSWVNEIQPENILDIGTGTGLLALMMAQKYPTATIDAIDIDSNAFVQALENVKQSRWHKNIKLYNTSIQDYSTEINKKYDLIISNPPFFTHSFKSNTLARNLARHNDSLPFEVLAKCAAKLLNSKGEFYLVLPFKDYLSFESHAFANGLHLKKTLRIKSNQSKEVKRVLLCFSFELCTVYSSELIIENNERHNYTFDYISLTKDYYLQEHMYK
jgi:tRNA1Val (adenine37-N6)-methyltransferase